ncbi:MAG: cell envelope biogenesis protein TolA [Synergistaceae bacterium]|jgi:vacuolar-type H+-ATPase subunit H|nr:cell envelope biogenesis protein TolA [Synergistaceae bacterium]
MAENLVDEIKAAEEKAARSVQDAGADVARRLAKAEADAENAVKEARQAAARQFRESVQAAEHEAETKASTIVAERRSAAEGFYSRHKDKTAKAAAWIAEEVISRYGRD